MALVEDPISAEEATALISKAKTIVESDMGVKVRWVPRCDERPAVKACRFLGCPGKRALWWQTCDRRAQDAPGTRRHTQAALGVEGIPYHSLCLSHSLWLWGLPGFPRLGS